MGWKKERKKQKWRKKFRLCGWVPWGGCLFYLFDARLFFFFLFFLCVSVFQSFTYPVYQSFPPSIISFSYIPIFLSSFLSSSLSFLSSREHFFFSLSLSLPYSSSCFMWRLLTGLGIHMKLIQWRNLFISTFTWRRLSWRQLLGSSWLPDSCLHKT